MNEIRALQKLRECSHVDDEKWILPNGYIVVMVGREPDDPGAVNLGDRWREIADEIEREVEQKWMRLPVDADGVPIRIGDEVVSIYGGPNQQVGSVTIDGFNDAPAFCARDFHHVKPRALEDVIYEVALDCVEIVKVNKGTPVLGIDRKLLAGGLAAHIDEIRESLERHHD